MKKLIAGNWKMNLDREGVNQLTYDLMGILPNDPDPLVEVLLCPPFLYLDRSDKFWGATATNIGAQNVAAFEDGAYTGEISAKQLLDMGCSYVIVGHSERRQIMRETNEIVKQKAAMALEYRLKPIICVGETNEDREQNKQEDVVGAQLDACIPSGIKGENIVIAYEPVWAIGTGKTATPDDVKAMHGFIRKALNKKVDNPDQVRILYGGSMKPDNAAELLSTENVDGGLIGGASLKADDFIAIVNAVKS